MDFLKYVNENMLVLVPVIYALGVMLKNTKKVADWAIPFILLIIALGLSFGVNGVNVQAIIQAVLVVAVAVYSNQLFKQAVEGFKKE